MLSALAILAGCHDAPRSNPLDPELTPAVELSVRLDGQAGTATLTWTPYAGDSPFAEYQVLRKVHGAEKVDTLAHLARVRETVYLDTSRAQDIPYTYRVAVVNTSGLAVASAPWETVPQQLPAVTLTRLALDSRTATAALACPPYRGSQFDSCRVERRTAELDWHPVFSTQQSTITSLVDSHLVGATEYFYRVVVVTRRGELVPSAPRSGTFHEWLGEWPLDLPEGGVVRLYHAPDDRIAALIADSLRLRLLTFSTAGQLLQSQVVLDLPRLWSDLSPRCLDLAWGPDDQALVSLVHYGVGGFSLGVLSLADDQPERTWVLPAELTGLERSVQGKVTLEGTFDNLRVTDGGDLLLAEDFTAFPEGPIGGTDQGWQFSGDVRIQNGWLYGRLTNAAANHASPATWQRFHLEADAINSGTNSRATIRVGGESLSRISLALDQSNKRVVLAWSFIPPPGSGASPQDTSIALPCSLMIGIPYHLTLDLADGQVRAGVRTRVTWTQDPGKKDLWSSLATVDGDLLLSVNQRTYTIDLQTREASRPTELEMKVSELRSWHDPRDGLLWLGACLPEINQIRLGSFPRGLESNWTSFLNKPELGPRTGAGAGFMSYPLSFAIGPDGRFFVLDAGNARILAFGPDRLNVQYLTQWGREGSGPGEFRFGDGRRLGDELNLAGSLVVDDQGCIYVADPGNCRVQRFAP